MTEPTQPGTSRLRVCLLHNYRESQQISMKLYAERLGSALEAQRVSVERLRPDDVLKAEWRDFWLGDKVDSYVGRFVHYPRVAWNTRDADVFHIIDHGQAHLISWLDPARTVVTCHDLMLLVLETGRLGRKNVSPVALEVFRGIAKLLTRAAKVVAVSEQTRIDLIRLVGVDPARVEVIGSGLNQSFAPDARLRQQGRRRWGLEGQQVMLQVGNAFYKNVEGTLRVLGQLRQRGLMVTLLRGGRRLSPEQTNCARKLGLSQALVDLGPLPDEDLCMLYNTADVLLCPSLYEGFGWPPLEAMACGTPVVCSRGGSLREVAGDAALLADPEDVDHLADHVATILTTPAVSARLRAKGIRHAAQFDWSDTAIRYLDLYRRVKGQVA